MSQAIIARIHTFPHPNADRLQLGNVAGHQVVVGLETKDGDLGIFFPEGLQLSAEYAQANDLIRRKGADGKPAGGFFEETRRVRCQKFRNQKSEGYFAPLSSLDFTSSKKKPAEGDRLSELNGVLLCSKYITPATRRSRSGRGPSHRGSTTMFHKHFDTDQLRFNLHAFRPGDLVVITAKLHGTSQRVGHVKDRVILPRYKRFVNWLLGRPFFPTEQWTYLVGTRNMILEPGRAGYTSNDFRVRAATPFLGRLHKGETVFFEVVGYETPGKPVMGRHSATGEIAKQYGPTITYHYGCQDGELDRYVYRITLTNEDGVTIDMPWEAVKARCAELGVKHVPEMCMPFPFWTLHACAGKALAEICGRYAEGPDIIGKDHPREGVVVRADRAWDLKCFKQKSFTFGVLEGYIRDNDNYVDTEEIA